MSRLIDADAQTMSRLIDADALVAEQWWVEIKGENIDSIAEQTIRQCKDIVRDAPTVDAVEVVFCKDCRKHNNGEWDDVPLADVCPLVALRGKARRGEFDYQYCVYGERRE